MATKTFKIGLSNTDKQNMAQDVYERLLALTFAEYDSSETYNEGDFVVYDDALYKCKEDNVTGTWDSSKWEQATLQDLLDDVEEAVASVNDKANVDGNYPTMTVGVADQLSPYDENSGDDQDEPFSLQATGTGNGTQPDFATGSIALMKEKQGNTVVVNQLVKNPNFTNTSNWTEGSATLTVSNNVGSIICSAQYGGISAFFPIIAGHKYLITASIKLTTATGDIRFLFNDHSANYAVTPQSNTNWQFLTLIATSLNTFASGLVKIQDNRTADWDTIQVKDVYCIDLTQWFNGDIPQDLLDHPEHFFRYYQGSLAYNEGTLVNANGRYIKCVGRQQWDEEWELGALNGTTGQPDDTSSTQIRSKNYCKCVGNADYYCYTLTAPNVFIWWYDTNKNYIDRIRINGFVRTAPANACYFKLTISNNDNTYTAYTNDVSINLYYEDEERCLTYEAYEVLTNNDTGNEVLRSAGSVKDYKTPDGTVHRRVGTITLDGSNDENYSLTTYERFGFGISDWASPNANTVGAISCNKLVAVSKNNMHSNVYSISGTDEGAHSMYIRIDSTIDTVEKLRTWLSNNPLTIFYELAEETTEQGTAYSENLVIDDFGSMDFDSAVPQGALIFYPVDYKAFVDTLYNYTDGTPSNIALKSDLPTAPQTWAESLPGYDATKTQTLKNVEGTLTWVDDE